MSNGDELYAFDRNSARKLRQKALEPRGGRKPEGEVPNISSVDVGTVITAITPAADDTGGSPGGGRVRSYTTIDALNGGGPLEYDVLNYFEADVAVGTPVTTGQKRNGEWFLVSANCPA